MKSFFKEIVSMTAISVAIILILILIFYDYLKLDTDSNIETKYSRSEEVSTALGDVTQSNQVITSSSKSLYSLDASDISNYVSDGILEKGKKHPFSDITSDTYDGINAINNNVVGTNATVPVTTPSTTITTTIPQTTATQNTTSQNKETTSNGTSRESTQYSTDTSEGSDSVKTGNTSSNKSTTKKKNTKKKTKPFFDDGTSK